MCLVLRRLHFSFTKWMHALSGDRQKTSGEVPCFCELVKEQPPKLQCLLKLKAIWHAWPRKCAYRRDCDKKHFCALVFWLYCSFSNLCGVSVSLYFVSFGFWCESKMPFICTGQPRECSINKYSKKNEHRFTGAGKWDDVKLWLGCWRLLSVKV